VRIAGRILRTTSPFTGPVAQHVFLDLSRRGLGQRLEVHPVGRLVGVHHRNLAGKARRARVRKLSGVSGT
jgi:hypothetical protein